MREIEFRAWHIKTKRLFPVYSYSRNHIFEDSLDGIGTSDSLPANTSDCIVMQYTGLKDKNGKKIFEGDIIRLDGSELVRPVVYDTGCFGFRINDQANLTVISFWKNREMEIIGNIYENPELTGDKYE